MPQWLRPGATVVQVAGGVHRCLGASAIPIFDRTEVT